LVEVGSLLNQETWHFSKLIMKVFEGGRAGWVGAWNIERNEKRAQFAGNINGVGGDLKGGFYHPG
jgi:hypothetical protein